MSTQQTLQIVGAAIGGYFGGVTGAQYGWAAGSVVGSFFQPDIKGPKLSDTKLQLASYGSPIAIAHGDVQIAGTVIWSLPELTASESSQSSKGSPDVVTTSYSATFAVAICEGEISGIRRIWAGSLLIYDITDSLDVDAQSQSASIGSHMTIYPGSEDQLPDPTIESFMGVGKVEAYRGTAYVVFNDLPVGRYGNTIPGLRFEVTTEPVTPVSVEDIEPMQIYPWFLTGDGVQNGVLGITQYDVWVWGDDGLTLEKILSTTNYGAAKTAMFGATTPSCTEFIGYYTRSQFHLSRFDFATDLSPLDPADPSPTEVDLCWAPFLPDRVFSDSVPFLQTEDVRLYQGYELDPDLPKNILASSIQFQTTRDGNALTGFLTLVPYGETPAGYRYLVGYDTDFAPDGDGHFPAYWSAPFAIIRATRIPTAPAHRCLPGRPELMGGIAELPGNADVCITTGGVITPNVAYHVESGEFRALREAGPSDSSHSLPGLFPVLRIGNADYDNVAFWEAAAADANIAGPYGGLYPHTVSEAAVGDSPFAQVGASSVLLSAIVADICRRAGLATGQIDVSELTDVVRGYYIGRPMAAREAIDALRPAYDFDVVESGDKIVFRKRGRASAATLTLDDLGAGVDEAVEPVEPTRKQEDELPREIKVAYLSADADFQIGTQQSRRRTVGSEQTVGVELPIVLSDLEAARIADRVLYQMWASRTERKFSTGIEHSRLEPADVVLVDDGERTVRVRIVECSDAQGVTERTAVDDDAGTLTTASAAGSTTSSSTVPIQLARPTKLEALDIPIIQDADDPTATGYYLAASGYGDGRWPGARIFRSTDDGASYFAMQDVRTAATIGTASQLGDFAGGNVVDEINVIDVKLNAGTLATITLAQLLNGASLCVVGSELLHYQRVEFLGGTTWRLSGLLRGRRGTETHIGTHVQGERFVLLDTATVAHTSGGGTSQLNVPTVLKGVTLGTGLTDAYAVDFTNTGVGAKPLAPVHLYATSDGAGGYVARWTRRTRIAGAGIRLGLEAPLGEGSEQYDVELRDADDALVSTDRVTVPTWSHSVAAAVVAATMPGRVLSVVAKSGSTYYTQQSDGVAARTSGGVVTSQTASTVSNVIRVLEVGDDLFIVGYSVPLGGLQAAERGVYRVAKSALGTIVASDASSGIDYFLDAVTDGTSLFLATSEGTVLKYSTALSLLDTYSLTAPNYINALAIDAGALYVAQGYLGTAQLIKFDIATEAVVWTVTVPEMRAYSGTLTVIDGAVVMVTNAGFLRYSVTDGAALSSLVLPDDFGPSSIYALDGRLLAGIYTVVTLPGATYTYQHIAEFDPATSSVLWRSDALGVSSTSITLLGSELWFANARIESTGSSDLGGYTLTVYQISDTVGRGFPASAPIT